MTSDNRFGSEQRPEAINSQESKILLADDESKLFDADVYGATPATADENAARRAFQYRSFRCPVCFANIAIQREQSGHKLVCPDCHSEIVAPTDLDFDSQTEYERRYFDPDKKKRDELYSPTRNPKRIGIDLSSSTVYGVMQTTGIDNQFDDVPHVAVRCGVCGTVIQVPRSELGVRLRCPDCFSEVVANAENARLTETTVERRHREEEKKKRDELYSPTRNPNRVGIDLNSRDVYGLSGETAHPQNVYPTPASNQSPSATPPKRPKSVLYPVRCRVCETIMHVPRERLGQKVTCPDCGTESIATSYLKEQQETVDTRFQPRDRGIYDLGAVPLPPSTSYRTERGEIVKLDGSKPSIAPLEQREPQTVTLEEFKKKHGIPSAPAVTSASVLQSATESTVEKPKAPKKKKKTERNVKSQVSPEDNLPPRVLRRRNGEFVWTTASPPEPFPLLNGAFSPLRSVDLWARAIMLGVILAAAILIGVVTELASDYGGAHLRAASTMIVAVGLLPVSAFAVVSLTQFFSTIYRSSSMGARRVLDWTNDEQLTGAVLSGVRFALFLLAAISCGYGLVALALRAFTTSLAQDPFNLALALLALEIVDVLSWFFFATFWISSDARGAFFCPITISVLSSIWNRKGSWALFTLYTAFVLSPLSLASCLAIMSDYLVVKFLAAVIVPILALLSAPIVGRLAWIVEDNSRTY